MGKPTVGWIGNFLVLVVVISLGCTSINVRPSQQYARRELLDSESDDVSDYTPGDDAFEPGAARRAQISQCFQMSLEYVSDARHDHKRDRFMLVSGLVLSGLGGLLGAVAGGMADADGDGAIRARRRLAYAAPGLVSGGALVLTIRGALDLDSRQVTLRQQAVLANAGALQMAAAGDDNEAYLVGWQLCQEASSSAAGAYRAAALDEAFASISALSEGVLDRDGDGVGLVDNCPHTSNVDQVDADGDGIGDACDQDDDGDGVLDTADVCPLVADPEQGDADGNGTGDACQNDDDGDGILDTVDKCPLVPDPGQVDSDNDGIGDSCDVCPAIVDRDQTDSDSDGIGDVCDPDSDGDGILNGVDLCPSTASTDQTDTDNDGTGDACDDDDDDDGILDTVDNCLIVQNVDQVDANRDGRGDACQD